MQLKLYTCLSVLLAALFCAPATAQDIGMYNSPKGVGAQFRFAEHDGIFHTATAFVDIYGVMTSRCQYPGYRFNFSRQYIFKKLEHDDVRMTLYAGPGISFGYVHDHDKGRKLFDIQSLIANNDGFMFAVSGDIGCRFDFGKRIALDLSFTADAGLHVRRNEKEKTYQAANLSIYNNGLLQAFYPQLTILFKL